MFDSHLRLFPALLVASLGFAACATTPGLGEHPRRLQAEEAHARGDWMRACAQFSRWSTEAGSTLTPERQAYLQERLAACGGNLLDERMARIEQARAAGKADEAQVLTSCLEDWLASNRCDSRIRRSPGGEKAAAFASRMRDAWLGDQLARARAQIAAGGASALEGAARIEALFLTPALNGPPRRISADVLMEAFGARLRAVAETPGESLQLSARRQYEAIHAVLTQADKLGLTVVEYGQAVPVHKVVLGKVDAELAQRDLTKGAHGDLARLHELAALRRHATNWSPVEAQLRGFLAAEAKPFADRAKELRAQGRTGLALAQARIAAFIVGYGDDSYLAELAQARKFRWAFERSADGCKDVGAPWLARPGWFAEGGSGAEARAVVSVTQCDVETARETEYRSTGRRDTVVLMRCGPGGCWREESKVFVPKGGPTVARTQLRSRGQFAARLQLTGPWGVHVEEIHWAGEEQPVSHDQVVSDDGEDGGISEVAERQRSSLSSRFDAQLEQEVKQRLAATQERFDALATLPEPASPSGDDTEWKADVTVRRWALRQAEPPGGWEALARWLGHGDERWTRALIQSGEPAAVAASAAPEPVAVPWAGQSCPADFAFPNPDALPALTQTVPVERLPARKESRPLEPFSGYGGFGLDYVQPRAGFGEAPQRYSLSLGGIFLPGSTDPLGLVREQKALNWAFEGRASLGASATGTVTTDMQVGAGGALALWRLVLVPAAFVGFDRDQLGAEQTMYLRLYAGIGGRLALRLANAVVAEGWGQYIDRKDALDTDADYAYAPTSERRFGARLVFFGLPLRVLWLGARYVDYGPAQSLGGELGVAF